jgi:hypothetical protein
MFQLCLNFNKTHDSVGKTLRTANQGHVTANSHALSTCFDPGLYVSLVVGGFCRWKLSSGNSIYSNQGWIQHDLVGGGVQIFLGAPI